MTHFNATPAVRLRRLALARAVLMLIDQADDKEALLAILNGEPEAMEAGGLDDTQFEQLNELLEANPLSLTAAAHGLSQIIAANHGGGSMVTVATATSLDLARTIRLIDREVAQCSAKSDPRDLISRIGNIKQIVSGVAALLDAESSLAARSHGHGPTSEWMAAE